MGCNQIIEKEDMIAVLLVVQIVVMYHKHAFSCLETGLYWTVQEVLERFSGSQLLLKVQSCLVRSGAVPSGTVQCIIYSVGGPVLYGTSTRCSLLLRTGSPVWYQVQVPGTQGKPGFLT